MVRDIPVRLSVMLKQVEPELSCSKRYTHEVGCSAEFGRAVIELE